MYCHVLFQNNQALGRSKRRRTWGGQLESSLLLPMRVQLSTIKEDSMASSRQCKSIGADNISGITILFYCHSRTAQSN